MRKNSAFVTLMLILALWLLFVLSCGNTNSKLGQPPAKNSTPQTNPSVTTEPSRVSVSSSTTITKEEYGEAWAFTVDEGTLSCSAFRGNVEVLLKANGKAYAVNGTAKETKKYAPIDDVWAADPKIIGAKKDISVFIEKGLKICQ